MTDLLIAAVLVLMDGRRLACERLASEVGQITCASQCHPREVACSGDDPVVCEVIDVIHPPMVDRIEVAR